MSVRESAPPAIDGYAFQKPIGRGGFADVYLYDQLMPRRQVAVKVLLEAAGERERQLFDAEANVMAQLSAHPSIVPIYQAGVASDGRPYLVMEYCPPPNLSVRYRSTPLPVPEVLETMIKVAGAVETAHRAGILHRDIKPANILTNAYGAPKLTDFGIAHATGGEHEAVSGMSVPWAAPETFADAPSLDVRTDVWSLAATTWTLVAGRTPFEVEGGANDNATLMARIEGKEPTPITRVDLPAALVGALKRGMSKRIDGRPSSALAFARSLQEVQLSLQLETTRIDVLDSAPFAEVEEVSDERTSVRPVAVIVPDVIADRGTAIRPIAVVDPSPDAQVPTEPATSDQIDDHTAVRMDRTVLRQQARQSAPSPVITAVPTAEASRSAEPVVADEPTTVVAPGSRRTAKVALGIAGVGALAACVAAVAMMGSPAKTEPPGTLGENVDPASEIAIAAAPAPVGDLTLTRRGAEVTATWTATDARPTDSYQWTWTGAGAPDHYETVSETTVTAQAPSGGQACMVVRVLRGSTVSDPSPITCAVAP